jgi:hypothetical protein
VTEALGSYRQATDAYADVTRQSERARTERAQADEARGALRAAKERARPDHPDFKAAIERERQADALYTRRSFTDATAGFGAATALFAKAAVPVEPEPPKPVVAAVQTPPPAAPAPVNSHPQVRAALDAYVKAIEKKDLVALRSVRPGLTDADLQRWAAFFEITRTRRVDLKVDDITVDGNAARATGRRGDTTVLTDGQRIQKNTRFVYTLSRASKGWVLQTMNEVEDGAAPRAVQAERSRSR